MKSLEEKGGFVGAGCIGCSMFNSANPIGKFRMNGNSQVSNVKCQAQQLECTIAKIAGNVLNETQFHFEEKKPTSTNVFLLLHWNRARFTSYAKIK